MDEYYHSETYYTLESNVYGTYQRENFKTYKEAYEHIISLYDAECYNRKPHGYWYIKEHKVTEYISEDGTLHKNEMVQSVWR